MKYRWLVHYDSTDFSNRAVSVIAPADPVEAIACFRRAVKDYVEAIVRLERMEQLL